MYVTSITRKQFDALIEPAIQAGEKGIDPLPAELAEGLRSLPDGTYAFGDFVIENGESCYCPIAAARGNDWAGSFGRGIWRFINTFDDAARAEFTEDCGKLVVA